jgi:uncharacterized protein (UPF0332 family)
MTPCHKPIRSPHQLNAILLTYKIEFSKHSINNTMFVGLEFCTAGSRLFAVYLKVSFSPENTSLFVYLVVSTGT